MLYQESNPVPIMSVETSTTDLQEELFDCRRLILKTAIERNMKAAVINQVTINNHYAFFIYILCFIWNFGWRYRNFHDLNRF